MGPISLGEAVRLAALRLLMEAARRPRSAGFAGSGTGEGKGLIRRGSGEVLRQVGPLKLALSEALAKVFRRTKKKTSLRRKKTFYRHVFSCIC
ncbi:hypothetical protein AADU03_005162 [Escherichia coli]